MNRASMMGLKARASIRNTTSGSNAPVSWLETEADAKPIATNGLSNRFIGRFIARISGASIVLCSVEFTLGWIERGG